EFMDLQEQLLKCSSLPAVCRAIEATAQRLGLMAYLRLVDTTLAEYRINQESLQRFSTNHFNGKQAYLGRLRQADRGLLFGEQCVAPEM
ncbi:DUF484 family protein, partial [Bacillus cereus group sp. Bc248]